MSYSSITPAITPPIKKTEEKQNTVVYIKGNCSFDDLILKGGHLIIDGSLTVDGSLELSSETGEQAKLEVKENIYASGSVVCSKNCSISSKNIIISN